MRCPRMSATLAGPGLPKSAQHRAAATELRSWFSAGLVCVSTPRDRTVRIPKPSCIRRSGLAARSGTRPGWVCHRRARFLAVPFPVPRPARLRRSRRCLLTGPGLRSDGHMVSSSLMGLASSAWFIVNPSGRGELDVQKCLQPSSDGLISARIKLVGIAVLIGQERPGARQLPRGWLWRRHRGLLPHLGPAVRSPGLWAPARTTARTSKPDHCKYPEDCRYSASPEWWRIGR
jgi:hypothetical protein